MRKQIIILSLTLLSFSSNAISAPLDCADPKSYIKSVAGEITAILREPQSSEKRKAALIKIFDQVIDIDFMSQYTLGHQWAILAPKDQEEFKQAYREYLSATYVHEIKNYTGKETVNVFDAKLLKGQLDAYLISASIVNSTSDTDDFSTLVRKNGACYKIGDVISEGVSILNTERQDFTSVLNHQGFPQLIGLLNDKAAAQ